MKRSTTLLHRSILLLLVLALIGGVIPAALAQGGTATTLANIHIRSGPGVQYRSLGILPRGTTFTLQGQDYTLLWGYGTAGNGATGWVAARHLTGGTAGLVGLPILDPATLTVSAPGTAAQPQPVTSGPAPVAVTGPVTGFAYGGHIRGYGQDSWMRTAGMTWVKVQIMYNVGADPNSFAGVINDAHARGYQILIGGAGHSYELASSPNYIEQYANFLGGLAALGADAIEVWNEPNIDREWPTGRIDPVWYTQVLAAAYNAIKARNPNTMVVSAAPAPTGAEGAFGTARVWNDDHYIYGLAAAGAAQYMDCLGLHYNEGIIGPSQRSGDPRDGYYTRYFWGMLDTYWNAFGGQRPLCFTELGYLTSEGYGPLPGGFSWAGNVTVAQQASWLAEAISLARGSGRVRLLIVWNVDFTGTYGDDPMGGYAIVRPDGSCPACEAIARAR